MNETEAADPEVLLEHHLKKLKLPTFLSEYGKIAGICAAEGVVSQTRFQHDHPRYLLRLAEIELIERERRMVERRIRAAKFVLAKPSFAWTRRKVWTVSTSSWRSHASHGRHPRAQQNACTGTGPLRLYRAT